MMLPVRTRGFFTCYLITFLCGRVTSVSFFFRFLWFSSSAAWLFWVMPRQSAGRRRTKMWCVRCAGEPSGSSARSASASTSSWSALPSWWLCRTSWRNVSGGIPRRQVTSDLKELFPTFRHLNWAGDQFWRHLRYQRLICFRTKIIRTLISIQASSVNMWQIRAGVQNPILFFLFSFRPAEMLPSKCIWLDLREACRPKCFRHIFKAFFFPNSRLHVKPFQQWKKCKWIISKRFCLTFWCSSGVSPPSSGCSVCFLLSVNYWLPGGRDAVSLVHWPQICPLHHVPHHNPAPVHPKRNWHPEVHKVTLIF